MKGHKTYHTERIAEMVRIELSQMIEGEVRDPRVGFATVTEVRMTPDQRNARVFVSVQGDEEQVKQTMQGLVAASSFLRHGLAESLSLRRTPELLFELDHSGQTGGRVEELLKRLKK
jgi:ribosome-binding factor A